MLVVPIPASLVCLKIVLPGGYGVLVIRILRILSAGLGAF